MKPTYSKPSTKRPSGSPDEHVANGRMSSSQNPGKGGNAFSAYGLSEKMKSHSRQANPTY